MTKPLGDEIHHLWLARSMARCAGVDLALASDSGRLSQEDWAGMVHRCRSCDWADGCPSWMEAHRREHPDTAAEVPGACANARQFRSLAAAGATPEPDQEQPS